MAVVCLFGWVGGCCPDFQLMLYFIKNDIKLWDQNSDSHSNQDFETVGESLVGV